MEFTNDIYTRNLNALKKRARNHYILEVLNANLEDSFRINILQAKDGNPSMSIEKNDQTLYVHSKYKPISDAEMWAQNLEITADSRIILFGFGLGYHVLELQKRLSKESVVYIVEPNINIFFEALKYNDLIKIIEDERFIFLIGKTKEEINKILLSTINWFDVYTMSYFVLPNYDKLFAYEYRDLLLVIRDAKFAKSLDVNTILHFANQWQENILKNIPHIIKSHNISDFFNKFSNKPAIIVSAGPSLSNNINTLKQLKNKAVIIAVGTALKALLKENIKPDLVISIDGGIANYRHFEGLDYDELPLVYTSIIYPDILNDHKGEKIYFSGAENYTTELFKKYNVDIGQLQLGGSVANSAYDLAINIGANPIIFVGQDLAYTDNKTHAKGTTYEANEIEDDKEYFYVEDILGNQVLTDHTLNIFRLWFENRIANDKSGRLFIDATEGGAKIKGTEIIPLHEVKEKYCQEDLNVDVIINQILENKMDIKTENVISDFTKIYDEFEKISRLCGKGNYLSEELYSIYKLKQIHKEKTINTKLEKLDKIDQEIKEKMKNFDLITFILNPLLDTMVKLFKQVENEDYETKRLRSAEFSIIIYKNIKNAVDTVQPLLKTTIAELIEER